MLNLQKQKQIDDVMSGAEIFLLETFASLFSLKRRPNRRNRIVKNAVSRLGIVKLVSWEFFRVRQIRNIKIQLKL